MCGNCLCETFVAMPGDSTKRRRRRIRREKENNKNKYIK